MEKTLEAQYRQEGSQKKWEKTPEQMSGVELREYLDACQVEADRVEKLMYKWATHDELLDKHVLGSMIEDLHFLRGTVTDCQNRLDTLENEIGRDVVQAQEVVQDILCEYYDEANDLEGAIVQLREFMPIAQKKRWDFWQAYPNGVLPR